LSDLGFSILDSDSVVHQLEASGGAAVEPIRNAFGDSVICADGSVDRKMLGKLVFADTELCRKLNAIVHPLVEERVEAWLRGEHSGIPLVVIPLLFELGWEGRYDCVVALVSDKQRQTERLVSKRGMTLLDAEQRLASQLPISFKMEHSDIVVINNGSAAALKREAVRVSRLLKKRYE
jgi:dephospho-CoA kinase